MSPALVLAAAVLANDPVPKDDDVVAGGWGAFFVVALIVATVILLLSFLKQMRKAKEAKDAGVYGDPPVEDGDPPDDTGAR